ncbi:glutathione S-transferase family protein [Marinobacterium jannaschii]|uniref:glutathione S-transferase family protein n=1 Tax=Marinobacterium jannaschii TaxID=64970 RepID=UPI000488E23A|nr:glutathione S-transferase family protein [Marinobacterium jannaschii]
MTRSVHIFGPQFSSFVRSVQLCCEEKGISYSLGLEVGGKEIGFKSEEHFALHPFGKIPVLIDGDRVLCETASICRYLDTEFDGPALQPEAPEQRALVDQWCALLSIYVDKALVRDYLLEFAFPKGEGGTVRMDKVAEAQPAVLEALTLVAGQLDSKAYLMGNQLTLADLIIAPQLDYIAALPHGAELIAPDSALAAYVERLSQRESGQKVLKATRK